MGEIVPHDWGVLSPPRFLADAEGGHAPIAEVRCSQNLCHNALEELWLAGNFFITKPIR